MEGPAAGGCLGSRTPAWPPKPLPGPPACLPHPQGPGTYRCGVGSASPERQWRRVKGAQLACHLLHPPQRALPIRIRQLDHEAGRGALGRAGEATVTGPDPWPWAKRLAHQVLTWGTDYMWGGGARPHPTGLTLAPCARPHRHGPAAVQTLDGRLSFPLTPKLHKGTAWGRIEGLGGSGHKDQRIVWPRVRQGHQEIPGSAQVTFTGAIRAPQDSAFLDMAEGLEQASDVLLTLLLPQHSHKQLSVLWGEIQE